MKIKAKTILWSCAVNRGKLSEILKQYHVISWLTYRNYNSVWRTLSCNFSVEVLKNYSSKNYAKHCFNYERARFIFYFIILQNDSLCTNFSPMDMFSFKGERGKKLDNLKKKMLDRAVFNRRIKLHMRIVSLLCTVTMIEIAMSWPWHCM